MSICQDLTNIMMSLKNLETRSNIAFFSVFSKLTPNKVFLHPLIAFNPCKIAGLRHHKNFAETKNSALVGMQEQNDFADSKDAVNNTEVAKTLVKGCS